MPVVALQSPAFVYLQYENYIVQCKRAPFRHDKRLH